MKVGQLMECDFGNYTPDRNGNHHADGHVPPEMVKKRMVVVLNPKFSNGCIVVPVSSTCDKNKVQRGYHVEIDSALVTKTAFYDTRARWAKADLVQQVSKDRIASVRGYGGRYIQDLLPSALVAKIQKAVLVAVNGRGVLEAAATAGKEEAQREAAAEPAVTAEVKLMANLETLAAATVAPELAPGKDV